MQDNTSPTQIDADALARLQSSQGRSETLADELTAVVPFERYRTTWVSPFWSV